MKYKVVLIISVVVLVAVAIGSYASSKGRLYVDLSNVPENEQVTLTIQNSGGEDSFQKIKNKSSVTLKSGSYAISLQNANNSLIKTVSVPSFFGKTTVSGSLVNEQRRTFVGTNPSPCVLYVATVFYSTSCGDDIGSMQQQITPTLSSPGYTTKSNTSLRGTILATTATNNYSYALLENYADDETLRNLVQIGANLTATKNIQIPATIEANFEAEASGTKVLVYSKDARVGYIYDEVTGSIEKVTLPSLDNKYELMAVTLTDGYVVTTYSESEASDSIEADTVTGSSVLHVQELGKKSTEYSVSKLYYKAVYCGQGTVCAVGSEGLDIYSITGDSLRKTSSYPGVTDIITRSDGVRFIDNLGIKKFDVQSRTGYYEYTFGGYTACGISNSVSGYTVCVIDTKQQKHALFISTQDKAGIDDVDKKVLDLLKSYGVSGVAAVNNFIYVIPDYGDVDIFTQDNESTARINTALDTAIQKSSISKQEYFVINAGSPL